MAKKLRNMKCRRRAPFGSQEVATLTAAGINAAATLVSAGIASKATKDSAKQQADAINSQAIKQSNALAEQNRKNKELQEQSIEFMREENAENRAIQKDMQMQLQMAMGQQNTNDRLEASKIKVKNGGKVKRLKSAKPNSNNLNFSVTDGGGVAFLGNTPEGYELYELYGNDHEHYHKAQNGKSKTGVGIKFEDGEVIEGEGNQNTSSGEKLLVTPDNGYFISKHTIKGFNPAKAIDNGLHPMVAFQMQESIKNKYNIPDDGRKAKIGTSLRLKDIKPYKNYTGNYVDAIAQVPIDNNSFTKESNVIPEAVPSNKGNGSINWGNFGSNLASAGIESLGNIGASIISTRANRQAAGLLGQAYANAGARLADAYRNLQTIDTNLLSRDDFSAGKVLPAIQAPVSFAQNKVTEVNRQLQRRLSDARKYSLSGASAQSRARQAEIDAMDMKNKIYSEDERQMQAIRQANAERITQAAATNAQLATAANKDYGENRLRLAMYNNEIVNDRITKPVEALADSAIQSANAHANALVANGQTWGNAITSSSKAFANTLSDYSRLKFEYDNELSGADYDAKVTTVLMRNDRRNARRLYDDIKVQLLNNNLDPSIKAKYEDYKERINNQYDFE